ncbi:hypothetical protein N9154_01545 [Akkermansiaceae bacterium]|nr:hypothetical protein [Akkermansiaceae bacterium]
MPPTGVAEAIKLADSALAIVKDVGRIFRCDDGLGPQTNVIEIFAKFNIEGGIEVVFKIPESAEGKAGFKLHLLMSVLPNYGENAKYALPKIKAIKAGKFQREWDALVKEIAASSGKEKMRY